MADHAAPSGINIGDGAYDALRRLVEILLPGLGVFYYTIAHIWKLGHADEVVATFAAIGILGGVVLKFARKGYQSGEAPPGGYDGEVVEDINEDGQPVLRLQLDTSAIDDILNKKQIVIKGYDPTA
jgi:Putative phage holin Dp-1